MSDLLERLEGLADCDSRAGEPLGKVMREAAAEIRKLREALGNFVTLMAHCQVTDGSCCCGEDMETHSITAGHTPVDHGGYVADHYLEIARAALGETA